MMNALIIFLGVVIGIILFLGIIALIIWSKIKASARAVGINDVSIKNITRQMHQIKEEDSTRHRSASGMTELLLPNIIRDFPEFNENQIYNMTESSLRTIFESITNKDTSGLNKVPLLKESLNSLINDYRNNGIDVEYRDIIFHEFAIKDYTKEQGVATVTISTTLEYYYKKTNNGNVVIDDRYKKQTRYACKFIYIYNESLFKDYEKVIVTNCPNCGAVIKGLGHKYCEYCGTAIKEINLKAWTFSNYEEY